MDPDANLREQATIVARLLHRHPNDDADDGVRLAELVQNLVAWLAGGGFAPDWQRAMRHWLQPPLGRSAAPAASIENGD